MSLIPIKFDFDFNSLPDNLDYYYDESEKIFVLIGNNIKYYILPEIKEIDQETSEYSFHTAKIKRLDTDIYEIIEIDKNEAQDYLTIPDLKTSDYLYNNISSDKVEEIKVKYINNKYYYNDE